MTFNFSCTCLTSRPILFDGTGCELTAQAYGTRRPFRMGFRDETGMDISTQKISRL